MSMWKDKDNDMISMLKEVRETLAEINDRLTDLEEIFGVKEKMKEVLQLRAEVDRKNKFIEDLLHTVVYQMVAQPKPKSTLEAYLEAKKSNSGLTAIDKTATTKSVKELSKESVNL